MALLKARSKKPKTTTLQARLEEEIREDLGATTGVFQSVKSRFQRRILFNTSDPCETQTRECGGGYQDENRLECFRPVTRIEGYR